MQAPTPAAESSPQQSYVGRLGSWLWSFVPSFGTRAPVVTADDFAVSKIDIPSWMQEEGELLEDALRQIQYAVQSNKEGFQDGIHQFFIHRSEQIRVFVRPHGAPVDQGSYKRFYRCVEFNFSTEMVGEVAGLFCRLEGNSALALWAQEKSMLGRVGQSDHLMSGAVFEYRVGRDNYGAIFQELMEKTLRDLIKTKQQFPIEQWKVLATNVILACRACHEGLERNHCDIKPENLLVSRGNDTVRLGDYGFSTSQEPQSPQSVAMAATPRGTPKFMAPWLYKATERNGRSYILWTDRRPDLKSDLWALGRTLRKLSKILEGRRPPRPLQRLWLDLMTERHEEEQPGYDEILARLAALKQPDGY